MEGVDSVFGTNCDYMVNGGLTHSLETSYIPVCCIWYTSVVVEMYPGTYMVVGHWLTLNGEVVIGQPMGTCIMGTCTLN